MLGCLSRDRTSTHLNPAVLLIKGILGQIQLTRGREYTAGHPLHAAVGVHVERTETMESTRK